MHFSLDARVWVSNIMVDDTFEIEKLPVFLDKYVKIYTVFNSLISKMSYII